MATTKDEFLALAKIPPSKRTEAQQSEVTRGSNILEVKNADFYAHQLEGTTP